MPILSPVESRTPAGRFTLSLVTLVLIVGGATMVYPFVVMLSGSLRSGSDEAQLSAVPAYLTSTQDLYKKFLERKYLYDVGMLNRHHHEGVYRFEEVALPAESTDAATVDAFRRYLTSPDLPGHWTALGGLGVDSRVSPRLRELRSMLRERFDGDLDAYTRETGGSAESWLSIRMRVPEWTSRRFAVAHDAKWHAYEALKAEADPASLMPMSITGEFLTAIVFPRYGRTSVAEYNAAHVEPIDRFTAFSLPAVAPGDDQPVLRAEWLYFVRDVLNCSFITVLDGGRSRWAGFLENQYGGGIDDLNEAWGSRFTGFGDIPLPHGRRWLQGVERSDYEAFLATVDPETLQLTGPEYDWPGWLAEHSSVPPAVAPPPMPIAAMEARYVADHRGELRWSFATLNYLIVWDELVLEGRALLNTVIYCALAVVLTLIVNPLAAYGLSRFQLAGTYKVLLIVMATIAFPPMVALLPQFLVLRELNLMNTFVALLLPLAVNGYLIFLLKGFFDSLPRELYEAARIDGAGEARMFLQITMALSQPILAVLALNAFTAAYASFLYPLLVAPDEDMWLIAVWLYQFQQRASSGTVYAAVIIASVPTLVMFLLVQNVIMRGIVVPTEK